MSAMIVPSLYVDNSSDSWGDTNFVLTTYRHLMSWSTDERVLDVGCGPGNVTASAIRLHLPPKSVLVGGDLSKEMVEFAKNKYEDDLTKFKQMDIVSDNMFTSWNKNEFTKVVSFYTLHRVRNLKQGLTNIYDLLKPGGEAVLQFITNDHPGFRLQQELVKFERYAQYRQIVNDVFHFCTINDPVGHVQNELVSTNFEVIKVVRVPRSYNYESVDCFIDTFASITPLVHKMSPSDFQKAVTDAKKLVESGGILDISNKGGVISNYTIVVAVARKPELRWQRVSHMN